MPATFRVQRAAGQRLDEIYTYTRDTWGDAQAELYLKALFAKFDDIAARRIPWRQVPAEFGVDGFYCRHEKHVIYWRVLADGAVGIATVLHARVHQMDRFREDAATQ